MIETKIIICDQHIPEDQMQNNNVNLNTITCLGEERSSTLEQWQWAAAGKEANGTHSYRVCCCSHPEEIDMLVINFNARIIFTLFTAQILLYCTP